jgi:hypothetical protein
LDGLVLPVFIVCWPAPGFILLCPYLPKVSQCFLNQPVATQLAP